MYCCYQLSDSLALKLSAYYKSTVITNRESGNLTKMLTLKNLDLERAFTNLKLECAYLRCQHTGGMFTFLCLSMLPVVLQSFTGIMWYYSVPLVCLAFAFSVNATDKNYQTAAMRIVSDHKLIKLIAEEMPRWTTNDAAPCEWVNDMMQQCWGQLAQYGCNKVSRLHNRVMKSLPPVFFLSRTLTLRCGKSSSPSFSGPSRR
jgi:hypothetical protein